MRAAATDPLNTFKPTAPFLPILETDSKLVCTLAANRIGKTYHAAYMVARDAVSGRAPRQRWIGPTAKQVSEAGARYLADFLRPHLDRRSYYVPGRGFNKSTILLQNQSIIQLRSCEDRVDSHAGDALDRVVFDEPPTRGHFAENVARVVSRNGQVVLALTAVGRPVTWLRKLVEVEQPELWEFHQIPFRREYVPWYSEEQVQAHLNAMKASPWQWQQRIEAAWEGLVEGRLFACFVEENVQGKVPSGDLDIGIGIDHGTVAGHQVAVLVAYRGSRVWVIDEYKSDWSTTPDQDAGAIVDMIKRNGLKISDVSRAVGDTNYQGGARVNDLIEEAITKRIGRRCPFRIRNADKSPGSVDYGYRVLNYASDRRDLRVLERCEHVLAMFRNWRGGTKYGTTDAEYSHAADALRYIAVDVLQGAPQYARLRID